MRTRRALVRLTAGACLAAAATVVTRPAAATSPDQAVHAVVFIDLIPGEKRPGMTILTDYVRRARHDRNLRSIELIEQTAIPNHLILEESFSDRSAYARFGGEDYVRAFRATLFSHLGSPWDERLGVAVSA